MKTTYCYGILFVLFTLFMPLIVLAQTPITSSDPRLGSISQTPQTAQPGENIPPRAVLPGLDEPVVLTPAPPGTETLYVKAFRFQDAEKVSEDILQELVAPYVDHDLTLAQLQEAATRVTMYYQALGYFLAQAFLPQQDASGGIVTIAVVIGRFGDTYIDNQSLVTDSIINNAFGRVKPGEIAERKDLERGLLLVSDLPGADVPVLTVGPGQTHGTADLGIQAMRGDYFNGYLTFDNQGSRYTGRYRVGAGIDLNSVMGIGEHFSISGVATDEIDDGLLNGRFAFSLPLFTPALRAEASVERTTYELNKEYRSLDAVGYSDEVRLGLSCAVVRSQDQNLWLNVSASYKNIKDEIKEFDDITRKYAWLGRAGFQYENWVRIFGEYRLYTSFGANLTFGNLKFPNDEKRSYNKLGADTEGCFSYANLSFLTSYNFTPKFSATLTVNAQKALGNKNLDGSEQFIISGPAGVRGYRETVSGDNGYFANLELHYKLPLVVEGLNHSVGLFGGMARSYYEDGSYTTRNGMMLYDVGLGYYANYEPFFAKLQLAQIVGPRPDNVYIGGRTHFLAHIGITF